MSNNNSGGSVGLCFGNLAAAFVSWSAYKSVGWAIVHGFFGWLYVIYFYAGCAKGS